MNWEEMPMVMKKRAELTREINSRRVKPVSMEIYSKSSQDKKLIKEAEKEYKKTNPSGNMKRIALLSC